MTALRDPTPSAAEMWLALFPSRASFLRSSTASAVHCICMLQSLSLRRNAARNGVRVDILVLSGRRDVVASAVRQFWKNFQFLQHLKKTNQAAIANLE